MGNEKCKKCGCEDIDTDSARGDAACTNCGSVVEGSIIVSEVQFEKRASRISATGQFVSSESTGAPRRLAHWQFGGHTDSRESRLTEVKKRIEVLGQQLQIKTYCIDMAFNFFKMAFNRRFTVGRGAEYVISACLYMVCRLEGSPQLLMDFCDALNIDIYKLAKTFNGLSSELCIKVPTLDPCWYVMRFAGALNFGAKTHTVNMTALRLVKRMKKDCIHAGRRPSGLCGAALIIAARFHEFNISVADIVKIVRVNERTLKKRLIEFGDTPSSSLSFDEFMTTDLDAEEDPPSFKARLKRFLKDEQLDQRMVALKMEIEKELEKSRSKKSKSSATRIEGIVIEQALDAAEDVVDVRSDESSHAHQGGIPPTFESLRLDRDTVYHEEVEVELDPIELDEDELNSYFLTPDEIKVKTEAFMAMHGDFLEKDKERRELKADKEARNAARTPRKRRSLRGRNKPVLATANEAIERVIDIKRLSKKINYESLKDLTLPVKKVVEPEVQPSVSGMVKEPEAKKPRLENGEVAEPESEEEIEEDIEGGPVESSELSVADLLNKHCSYEGDEGDNSYYDDEDDY